MGGQHRKPTGQQQAMDDLQTLSRTTMLPQLRYAYTQGADRGCGVLVAEHLDGRVTITASPLIPACTVAYAREQLPRDAEVLPRLDLGKAQAYYLGAPFGNLA